LKSKTDVGSLERGVGSFVGSPEIKVEEDVGVGSS